MKNNLFKKSIYSRGSWKAKPLTMRARLVQGKLFGIIPILAFVLFNVGVHFALKQAHLGYVLGLNILGLANCASQDSVFNVGVPPCDLAKKRMKGVIFADKGVTFSGADIASVNSFIGAVKTKTTAARGGRVYPIWDLLNFEDNTGEPSTGSVGNLTTATRITSDAIPAFRYGYNGTEARHKRIAAMMGASLDVFFVDEQFAVYGTEVAAGEFGGFSVLQAYADTSKFPVADSVNQYSFRVTLGSIAQYRDQSLYVVTNAGILAATGLININLIEDSNIANVYKIGVIADGGTNLEPLYGGDLDGLTWTATNLETGNAITVTSVADDTANKVLTITFDSTAYTALNSGDRIQLMGPSAADMATAGVKPYEIISLVITKA